MAPSQPITQPKAQGVEALSYVGDMVEAFKAFDADDDGLITASELRGIMASLGFDVTAPEAEEMMARGDTDRDGLLGLVGFLELNAGGLDLGGMAALLQGAVAALGPAATAGRGDVEVVTGEDLFNALGSMKDASMEECMDIVACLDGDGDGAISFEDLKAVAQALL